MFPLRADITTSILINCPRCLGTDFCPRCIGTYHLGSTGPVFMYTTYEKLVINNLIEMFPDLKAPLAMIVERLVDLHPIVKKHYYHPKMLGSWSIKAISPTIDPAMDYSGLTGIAEGMAASDGYLEAINPETTLERKAELEEQLLRYCRFDTDAMVKIVQYFTSDRY